MKTVRLKNPVSCLHKPRCLYCTLPSSCPSRDAKTKTRKKRGSHKEQSSAMSEVNHWRKHFNIFFSGIFLLFYSARGLKWWFYGLTWKGECWKGICFYCSIPAISILIKIKTSACCYHLGVQGKVNLGARVSEVEINISGSWFFKFSNKLENSLGRSVSLAWNPTAGKNSRKQQAAKNPISVTNGQLNVRQAFLF